MATLVRAYAQINRVQATALLIVRSVRVGGDRKIFDELESSIQNSRIIITGYVSKSDLPSYYSLMYVFVHPSIREGMPNALLEAMACERAVIATSVAGIPDVVMECDNGILIPANDAGAPSIEISNLFEDASLRRKLGVTARQTIIARFTPQIGTGGKSKNLLHIGIELLIVILIPC